MLTGTGSGINYFDVTTDQLALLGSGSLTITAPTGSTAIVNVSGTDARIGSPGNFGFFFNGIDDSDVLFNFYEATTLRTQSFAGSILAPLATVSFINGQFDGTLMAANLDSLTWQNGNFRNGLFDGQLPTVAVVSGPSNGPGPADVAQLPEPGSLLLLAGGLLGVGLLRRRMTAKV